LLQEYLERALDTIVTTSTDAPSNDDYNNHMNRSGSNRNSEALDGASGTGGAGGGDEGFSVGAAAGAAGDSPTPSDRNSGSMDTFPAPGAALTPTPTTSGATAAAAWEPEGTKMSLLLCPPGIPLNMESTCMALNERIVAAESCCFIAMVSGWLCPFVEDFPPALYAPYPTRPYSILHCTSHSPH
jgi:hypothetical protein